jgi:hypothetical protein
MSFTKILYIALFYVNSILTPVRAAQNNVALFRIEEKVFWSNQIAAIVKNINLLDCLFGDSTLLEIFPKNTNMSLLSNCSIQNCKINVWSKHHNELLYLIKILKTIELLKRRGGPFLTRVEQEKLLLPNAKACHLPPFAKWPNMLQEFINAELLYQDFLGDSISSSKDDAQASKVISIKRDIESLSHSLFYVPEN